MTCETRSSRTASLPDRWLELTTSPAPPGEAPLLVDALRRVGARTLERDGERVLALFPPPRDPAALVAEAAGVIRASTSLLPGFHAVLAPTGWLAISGVVRVERTAVLEAARDEGLVVADEEMEGGWWTPRLVAGGRLKS